MQPISVTVEREHEMWTMYFYGARCKYGCGASVIFKSPEGHMKRFSFRFTRICTNNVIEYETLYLGLSKAISMGIIYLVVHCDLKLVIKQVKIHINAKHLYLKTYRNRVWDLLESFLAINIISIPRKCNQVVDALAGKGAHYNLAHYKRGSFRVKFQCRPSVPNAAHFW